MLKLDIQSGSIILEELEFSAVLMAQSTGVQELKSVFHYFRQC